MFPRAEVPYPHQWRADPSHTLVYSTGEPDDNHNYTQIPAGQPRPAEGGARPSHRRWNQRGHRLTPTATLSRYS